MRRPSNPDSVPTRRATTSLGKRRVTKALTRQPAAILGSMLANRPRSLVRMAVNRAAPSRRYTTKPALNETPPMTAVDHSNELTRRRSAMNSRDSAWGRSAHPGRWSAGVQGDRGRMGAAWVPMWTIFSARRISVWQKKCGQVRASRAVVRFHRRRVASETEGRMPMRATLWATKVACRNRSDGERHQAAGDPANGGRGRASGWAWSVAWVRRRSSWRRQGTQGLSLRAHRLAPAERRTTDLGMVMRAAATCAHEVDRVDRLAAGERRAFDHDQHVDRHAFGMDPAGSPRP